MKATLWLGATALAAALAAGPALAAGDSAKQGMQQQGASAGAGAGPMQHDQATVRQAQERLNELGFEVGEADGIWGPQTQAALRQYRERQGLTASGELDSRTIAEFGLDSVGGGAAAGASSTAPSDPGAAGKMDADATGAANKPDTADKKD